MTKDKLSWEDIDNAVQILAEVIGDTKYKQIIAIGRGGMIPAVMLAHKLGIKDIGLMQHSRERGVYGKSFSTDDIRLATTLFIDDATETGGTIKQIDDYFAEAFGFDDIPVMKIQSAVLYCANSATHRPTFAARAFYTSECPIMPWEVET